MNCYEILRLKINLNNDSDVELYRTLLSECIYSIHKNFPSKNYSNTATFMNGNILPQLKERLEEISTIRRE